MFKSILILTDKIINIDKYIITINENLEKTIESRSYPDNRIVL